MKVRFKECTSAVPQSRPGIEREINDVLARHLIALGQAEAIEETIIEAPETAASRPRRKRGLGALFPQG